MPLIGESGRSSRRVSVRRANHVPGEFLASTQLDFSTLEISRQLREQIMELRPVAPARHSARKVFVFNHLVTSTHVFLEQTPSELLFNPLPYTGPHEILTRSDKNFVSTGKQS